MKVLEPGHTYLLDVMDSPNQMWHVLRFVNREENKHPGIQTQEVLRAVVDAVECLIDRTNHCDACLPWSGNERIIKAMSEAQRQLRLALLIHEERAMERKMDKDGWKPEQVTTVADGHFPIPREKAMKAIATAHWPGQDVPVCENHKRQVLALGGALGFAVSITPLPIESAIMCTNCLNEEKKSK